MIYCKKEVCATELDLLCKTERRPCHIHREFYFFLLNIVDFHFFFLPTCSCYDVQMWIFWSSFRFYRKHNSSPSGMLLAIDVSYIFTIKFRTFLFLKKLFIFYPVYNFPFLSFSFTLLFPLFPSPSNPLLPHFYSEKGRSPWISRKIIPHQVVERINTSHCINAGHG